MSIRECLDNNEYWLKYGRWLLLPFLGILGGLWTFGSDIYRAADSVPRVAQEVEELKSNVHNLSLVLPEVERLRRDVQALGDSLHGTLKHAEATLRHDIRGAEDRQRAAMTSHSQDERAAREALANSLKTVQANVIALKSQVEGKIEADDIESLISQVGDVTEKEASSFAEMTSISGAPRIQPRFLQVIEANAPDGAYSWKTARKDIENSLKVLMFAKDGKWKVEGKGLRIEFLGGTATFSAKPISTAEDLQRQVELFNGLSRAVDTVGGVIELPSDVPGVQVVPSPSPSMEMRAPDWPANIEFQ